MNASDFVVLGIFVLTLVYCTWRGFFMTIYSMVSTLLAVGLAFLLRPLLSKLIVAMGAKEMFYSGVIERLDAARIEHFGEATAVTGKQFAEKLNLPTFLNNFLSKNVASWNSNQAFVKVEQDVAGKISDLLVSLLAIIILIVIVITIMIILRRALKFFSKLPVIRILSGFGGFALGIILSILWISILGAVINLFATTPAFTKIVANIDASLFAKYFYNNNILMMLLAR